MSECRVHRSTTSRLSTAGFLRVGVPALLLAGLATFPAGGQPPPPTFSIYDITVAEGNNGTTTATFTVLLVNPNGAESRVSFTTSDETAMSGLTTTPFSSGGPITIADNSAASPYPATINVSDLRGPPYTVSLAVNGLTHPTPDDIDFLLVGPKGQSMIVQSDAGGRTPVTNVSYLLSDGGTPMPVAITAGVHQPFNLGADDLFPGPAPAGPHANPAPAGAATLQETFGYLFADGPWSIFIQDDTAGNQGSIRSLTLIVDVPDPGSDYLPAGGQLVFPPGTTSLPVTVTIFGDATVEPNETFFVDLIGAVNGVIGKGQGIGTILNDDGGSGGLPPTAVNDAFQTFVDTPLRVPAPGVLSNDTTNLGGQMTAQLVTSPTFGLLTLASNGSFDYIPGPNFVGTDSLTYRAVNAAGQSNIATVTITVNPATGPRPPTAVDDSYVAIPGGPSGGSLISRTAANGVLSNDLPNGGGPMTAVLVQGPANGSLELGPDGGFTYTTTETSFVETFTYRAVNANGTSNLATVTLIDEASSGPYGPSDLVLDEIYGDNAARRVRLRFDPPAQGPAPAQYALTGGLLPGQTLAQVLTGSANPVYEFIAPATGSYYVRVHAMTGDVLSAPSNEVPLHVNTTVTPSAPANLLAAVDGSNLTLAWKNTFLGGIPTSAFLRVTGDASVTIPLGATETFTYSPVPAGQYSFEVLNANAGGVSAASNKVTLAFPGPCSPPQTPTNFLLYVNGLILGAIWDLPSGGAAPTGYVLDVTSPIFSGSIPLRTTNIRAQVVPGEYTVSVQAMNTCGSSARTPEQTVVVP